MEPIDPDCKIPFNNCPNRPQLMSSASWGENARSELNEWVSVDLSSLGAALVKIGEMMIADEIGNRYGVLPVRIQRQYVQEKYYKTINGQPTTFVSDWSQIVFSIHSGHADLASKIHGVVGGLNSRGHDEK